MIDTLHFVIVSYVSLGNIDVLRYGDFHGLEVVWGCLLWVEVIWRTSEDPLEGVGWLARPGVDPLVPGWSGGVVWRVWRVWRACFSSLFSPLPIAFGDSW